MIGFVLLCLPVFGVIGLGFLAGRLRLMATPALDALGGFAFYWALPAMLLRLIAAQPLGRTFDPRFFAGYCGACLAVFLLALLASLAGARRGLAVAAAHAGATAMGNVGFLGPPLLLALMGERAAGPLAMSVIAEVMVVLAFGSLLMAVSGAAGGGTAVLRQALRAVVVNPVILGIACGILLGATGTALPEALDRFLGLLGGAAAPCALFALGGVLGRLRLRGRIALAAGGMGFGKLVAYPGIVWLALGPLLGLDPFWVQAGVLLAALPTATNAFVLAHRYGADAEQVSATVLLTTALAALGFPLTAWLLRIG